MGYMEDTMPLSNDGGYRKYQWVTRKTQCLQLSNDKGNRRYQWFTCNKNKNNLDPLRAKKIFIKMAEDGPYLGFSYKNQPSSVTL